jgi:HEPN domain-containing protein
MTKDKYIKYWKREAKDALETAESLFKSKKYHHCLFFCHLALEKIIKGLVVKQTDKPPLPIHNLNQLAKYAKIKLNPEQIKDFKEINRWNISARYDTIKRDLYKRATKEFTKNWFKKVKGLFQWLKNQY